MSAKAKRVSERAEHSTFLFTAYCGLVLRGFDKERDIADPILRRVWRLGSRQARARHGGSKP